MPWQHCFHQLTLAAKKLLKRDVNSTQFTEAQKLLVSLNEVCQLPNGRHNSKDRKGEKNKTTFSPLKIQKPPKTTSEDVPCHHCYSLHSNQHLELYKALKSRKNWRETKSQT